MDLWHLLRRDKLYDTEQQGGQHRDGAPRSINPSGANGIEIDGYYRGTGGFILNNVVGNVGLPNPGYNLRHCIYLAAYGTTVQII